MKRKELKIKLIVTDPTGIEINKGETSLMVIDDEESMKKERIFIVIGEHNYSINKYGEILDKIVFNNIAD